MLLDVTGTTAEPRQNHGVHTGFTQGLRLNAMDINRQKGEGIRGYRRYKWSYAFKHYSSTGCLRAARRPAFRLHWQGRVSPLAVASPSAPAFALGLFYWGNGLDLLHQYFCPWVLGVKPPVRMALLHLPVVLIDQPLHQVEDQRLVQVWPSAGVEDVQSNSQITRH